MLQKSPHLENAVALRGLHLVSRADPEVKMEIKKILRKGYQKQLLPALQKDGHAPLQQGLYPVAQTPSLKSRQSSTTPMSFAQLFFLV